MQRWMIGNVNITRIIEQEDTSMRAEVILPEATRENVLPIEWLKPHFIDEHGDLITSIYSLLEHSGDKRIVIDTCVGNDKLRGVPMWNKLQGAVLDEIAAAGFPRESVDYVVCTHLHQDHVGWNTREVDGRWVPTFPRARYLFARVEWEHWSHEKELGFAATLNESVRPLIDTDQADLVESDHKLTDEVLLEATPGHTPGHVAVRIASGGVRAMITGDLTHHPVQWAEPDWGMPADSDRAQATATRRRLIDAHADGGLLVIGTHYAPPTAGEIVSHEGGWRFRGR